ncbi:MAG: MlaD family protein [Omnitrophica bacterium]|nr:MlaD family protein [Candidatus Omnitrophota bacterium]
MPRNLWDRKRNLLYIKVGSFFLVAFFLFFITLLSIREVNLFKGTYPLTVTFEFVEGLRRSSPVRFCGVDVGEVETVTVDEKGGRPLVFVRTKIQEGVMIPEGAYFFVNSLSLFGEKYLEIAPPPLITGYIAEGEEIEGISPVPLFNVVVNFTKTMDEVKSFLQEGKIKTTVENTLLNLEEASVSIKELFAGMKNKEGTIGRLLHDDSLYKVTEEFITDLKAHPWKLLHKPRQARRKKK